MFVANKKQWAEQAKEWTSLAEIAVATVGGGGARCVNLVDYIFYSSYKDQSGLCAAPRRKSRQLDQIHQERTSQSTRSLSLRQQKLHSNYTPK